MIDHASKFSRVLSEDKVICRGENLEWSPPSSRQLPLKPGFTRDCLFKTLSKIYMYITIKKKKIFAFQKHPKAE